MHNDGVYNVSFRSGANHGSGLIFLADGTVYGSDHAYYYTGKVQPINGDDSRARVEIQVKRYAPGVSIFGQLDEFTLVVDGEISAAGSFSLEGGIVNGPAARISINGSKVGAL